MANKIINVNAELDVMKSYIADMERCTSIIKSIRGSAWNYQSNVKTNIFTILCTIFTLLAAIFQFHVILAGVGVVLALVMFLLARSDISGSFKGSCFLNIVLLVVCGVCFMYMYNLLPVAVLLVDWIYTIVSNYKFKKLIWNIGSSL